MSRPVDEMIQSIMDDFAAGKQTLEALEAKTLFRLLNYCPPPRVRGRDVSAIERRSEQDLTTVISPNE
jgi:hypothetical protein